MYKGNIHITATASLSLLIHAFTHTLCYNTRDCDKRKRRLILGRAHTHTHTSASDTAVTSRRCRHMHSHARYVSILVTTASGPHVAPVTEQSTHTHTSAADADTCIHTYAMLQCSWQTPLGLTRRLSLEEHTHTQSLCQYNTCIHMYAILRLQNSWQQPLGLTRCLLLDRAHTPAANADACIHTYATLQYS
jgi:hypothetical protein